MGRPEGSDDRRACLDRPLWMCDESARTTSGHIPSCQSYAQLRLRICQRLGVLIAALPFEAARGLGEGGRRDNGYARTITRSVDVGHGHAARVIPTCHVHAHWGTAMALPRAQAAAGPGQVAACHWRPCPRAHGDHGGPAMTPPRWPVGDRCQTHERGRSTRVNWHTPDVE
jgi:hypothetical protein